MNREIWNSLRAGTQLAQGYPQAILEPLFMLNYETGQIVPWVGESMTANNSLDQWTLKIRKGVTWSDVVPYTADDVVFTINLLLDNAPTLNGGATSSAALKDWVANVQKVDDQTVIFNLKKPNPRFQLDYFSVRIWGSVTIVPKHIWEGQYTPTFKLYHPAHRCP